MKDRTWQWLIGIVVVPVVAALIAQCSGNGTMGNGNLLISCSPGAKIEQHNSTVNADSLAEKIAGRLPGFNELKEKEQKIAELEKLIRQLQDSKNPLRQQALQALARNDVREYIRLLDLASRQDVDKAKKQAAQDQINIGLIAQYTDPAKAESAFNKAIEYWPDWNSYHSAGYYYQFVNAFDKAASLYQQALRLAGDKEERAMTLNNLGVLQRARQDNGGAERSYVEALKIYRELARSNPSVYQPDVAMTLNNLGVLQRARQDYGGAERSYVEALKIRRELARSNPSVYQPDVAMTLNNLGNLQSDRQDNGGAERSYVEALKIYKELARSNPSVYQPDVAMTLNNLGVLQSDRQDYGGAERSYVEALKIRRELARSNPSVYQPGVANVLNNLGNLQSDRQDYGGAERSYVEALKIRRELARSNPSVYQPDVAMTLNNLGILYQEHLHDKKRSLACVSEALRIMLPIQHKIPEFERYVTIAKSVVKDWGMDPEAFVGRL